MATNVAQGSDRAWVDHQPEALPFCYRLFQERINNPNRVFANADASLNETHVRARFQELCGNGWLYGQVNGIAPRFLINDRAECFQCIGCQFFISAHFKNPLAFKISFCSSSRWCDSTIRLASACVSAEALNPHEQEMQNGLAMNCRSWVMVSSCFKSQSPALLPAQDITPVLAGAALLLRIAAGPPRSCGNPPPGRLAFPPLRSAAGANGMPLAGLRSTRQATHHRLRQVARKPFRGNCVNRSIQSPD